MRGELLRLQQALSQLSFSEKSFDLYLFCNEHQFRHTIRQLRRIVASPITYNRIAIIVGESNILSLLPELQLHCDMVLFNDINAIVNAHTKILINCLAKATSRLAFKHHYQEDVKLLHQSQFSVKELWRQLTIDIKLNDLFFLDSEERFLACKSSAEQLVFSWTNADLFASDDGQTLHQTLQAHHAIVSICNVNNLLVYARRRKESLDNFIANLTLLLQSSEKPFILYSLGRAGITDCFTLISRLSIGKKHYHDLLQEDYDSDNFYQVETFFRRNNVYSSDIWQQFLTELANKFIKDKGHQQGIPGHYLPLLMFNKHYFTFDNDQPLLLVSDNLVHDQLIYQKIYSLFRELLPWHIRHFSDFEIFEDKRKIFVVYTEKERFFKHYRYSFRDNSFFIFMIEKKVIYIEKILHDMDRDLSYRDKSHYIDINIDLSDVFLKKIDLLRKDNISKTGIVSLASLVKNKSIYNDISNELITIIKNKNTHLFYLLKMGPFIECGRLFYFIQNYSDCNEMKIVVNHANHMIKRLAYYHSIPFLFIPSFKLNTIDKTIILNHPSTPQNELIVKPWLLFIKLIINMVKPIYIDDDTLVHELHNQKVNKFCLIEIYYWIWQAYDYLLGDQPVASTEPGFFQVSLPTFPMLERLVALKKLELLEPDGNLRDELW